MARRGKLGRLPRVAPSLTNTLVAIGREMQAKRDSNIMDAWRNGGTFEGGKATDEAVLAYWNERGKNLSTDDPNYEAIHNNILQLQYGIAQSKMDLLHVQNKISDTQYAQFFLKWSNKVPRDSEFYRTLQKDAAGLMEQAKARGKAASDKAKVDNFNAFVKSTTEGQIAVGNELTAAVQAMAQSSGLDIEGDGEQVLSLLTKDIASNPDKYHALFDVIRKVNPNWNGTVSQGFFAKSISQADHGYDLIANRANKDGFASAYASAVKAQSDMASWGADLKVWPVAQSYNSAFNQFHRVWDDPMASQMDKQAAAKVFADRVNGLSQSRDLDPATRSMLQADVTRVLGGDAGDTPSFGAAMLGHQGIDAATAAKATYYLQTDELMKTQPGAYVYAPTDKNGQFDPTGSGPLGVVPAGSVGAGAQMVAVPQLGGQAVMAALAPHSVFVKDPNDPNASPRLVGYSLSYQVGGKTIQMYGYQDGSGSNHWSLSAPWADGVTAAVDNKGDTYLTAPAPSPAAVLARAEEIDKKYGTNLAAQLKAGAVNPSATVKQFDAATGEAIGVTTVGYKDGSFSASQKNTTFVNGTAVSTSMSPFDLGNAFDPKSVIAPSRMAVGDIPGVTFTSPVAASMSAAMGGMSSDQVGHLSSDPLFQQAFVQQTMSTLGTQNPLDPRVAAAWAVVTSKANESSGTGQAFRIDGRPAPARTDLAYPGAVQTNNPANGGAVSINFGSQSLKLPGLPSYLGNHALDLSGAAGLVKTGADFLAPVLGVVNPFATAGGTPTPTAATGGGYNPGVTPTTTVTPTAPISTPTAIIGTTPIAPATAPHTGSGGPAPRPS